MRKIKFRGKAKMSIEELNDMYFEHDNGWFYGNLVMYGDTPYIVGDFIEVDQEYTVNEFWVAVHPESVGQYTGLKDKNGKEIYEGDIVTGKSFATSMLKHWNYDVEEKTEIYVIKYHHASFKTFDLKGKWVAVLNHHVSSKVEDLQVIGNIFEDKHLLKDAKIKVKQAADVNVETAANKWF